MQLGGIFFWQKDPTTHFPKFQAIQIFSVYDFFPPWKVGRRCCCCCCCCCFRLEVKVFTNNNRLGFQRFKKPPPEFCLPGMGYRKFRGFRGGPTFLGFFWGFWCFPKKMGTPQIIDFNRVFHYKPSIMGYLLFWKHPCTNI